MYLPPHLAHLPPPSVEAAALSDALCAHVAREITASGGRINFARYMELALYAPGLGYYTAGSRKLGEGGDFVTAPEMTPLFAQCIARQVAQLGLPHVLELGAGSGTLAVEMLLELERQDALPLSYCILEVSADLRERQRERVAQLPAPLAARVRWLDALPEAFEGVIVANEVLDATPAHRVRVTDNCVEELGVTTKSRALGLLPLQGQGHTWSEAEGRDGGGVRRRPMDSQPHPHPRPPLEGEGILWLATQPANGVLAEVVAALKLSAPYETEINLSARALVTTLAQTLTRGVMLFIDYGFPARELYHPHRNTGTLMCHYRHHAHDDPFALPGLQDITTHVDFSAVADAALAGGAELLGYVNQAQFLINCGITELLSQVPAHDTARYAPLAAAAQKLLSPAEMGELFKVIALGKGVDTPLLGFTRGDKSHTL